MAETVSESMNRSQAVLPSPLASPPEFEQNVNVPDAESCFLPSREQRRVCDVTVLICQHDDVTFQISFPAGLFHT